MLCACRYPGVVGMIIESQFFKRYRHGQESEEGKEDRESHQEGGKEDVEKENSRINDRETGGSGSKPADAKQISSKDLKGPCRRSGIEKRQDKIGPLCRRRRLRKGQVFIVLTWREVICSYREGSMPHGRDALAAHFTRAWSAKADAPTLAICLERPA